MSGRTADALGSGPRSAPPRTDGPPLQARHLERRYRGGAGLGPVDLRVDAGEIVAVMGPNGSGKTTLLLLLAGLLAPQRGELRWWGRADPGSARRHLGVALDSAAEDAALSGRQAATFWCRQWVADRQHARELVDATLARLGLAEVADRAVGDYSFGMRRRLSLAQALAHGPRLILLDEPTAGLDPEGAAVLTALLRELSAGGTATLLASNDAAFVAGVAGRVILLDEGRFAHSGTTRELLARCGPARWAEVEAEDPGRLLTRLRAVPELGGCERVPGGVRVRLSSDRSLAQLVLAADAGSGRLRGLRVHETDLADCFRQLTGHLLDEAGE